MVTILKISQARYKNSEKWMSRLCLAAIECNYKEIDRYLKEQFIDVLNDIQMLTEIRSELIKVEENANVRSEQV